MTTDNSQEELKKEVYEIADYLGCNDGELWSVMSKLIEAEKKKAVAEFAEGLKEEAEPHYDRKGVDFGFYCVLVGDIDAALRDYGVEK